MDITFLQFNLIGTVVHLVGEYNQQSMEEYFAKEESHHFNNAVLLEILFRHHHILILVTTATMLESVVLIRENVRQHLMHSYVTNL